MVNLSTLILSSEVVGPGGLFDFDATLPLIMVQFLLLIVILNILLYEPLLTVIEERQDYILTNLSKAAELLAQTNELVTTYEENLSTARKQAQLEITNSQKIHKDKFEQELNSFQKSIDTLLFNMIRRISIRRTEALNDLPTVVQSLSKEVSSQLLD